VYSSLRDFADCQAARAEAGVSSNSWHGDTYKVVLAIHDLFPQFSYATIIGEGNPQTLVWRQSRRAEPAFETLEAISRTDYFQLQKLRALLNPIGPADLERLELPPPRRR
jgi:hypothetical protein